MKIQAKRALIVAAVAFGLFVLTALITFIIARVPVAEGRSLPVRSLVAGGVVGLASLPILIWLSLRPVSLEHYSAFALEEIELDEKELANAVENWVYANHRRRVEDDLRFLEDDEGNVTCRVTVRKE